MLVLTPGAAFAEFGVLSTRSGQWLQSLVPPAAGASCLPRCSTHSRSIAELIGPWNRGDSILSSLLQANYPFLLQCWLAGWRAVSLSIAGAFHLLCSVLIAQALLPVNSWRAGNNWAAPGSEGEFWSNSLRSQQCQTCCCNQQGVGSTNLLGALLTCRGWLDSSLPLLMPELGGSGGVNLGSCGQRVLLHLTSVRLVWQRQ